MIEDHERPKVPCELCGQETIYAMTKRCDPCWELEHRIQADLDLAKKIIAREEAKENGLQSDPS